jgi:hypothetical protein
VSGPVHDGRHDTAHRLGGSPDATAASVCDSLSMRRSVLIVDDHAAFRSAAPELLCSGRQGNEVHTEGSQIEGRWKLTWTRTELVHAGLPPSDAAKLAGLV